MRPGPAPAWAALAARRADRPVGSGRARDRAAGHDRRARRARCRRRAPDPRADAGQPAVHRRDRPGVDRGRDPRAARRADDAGRVRCAAVAADAAGRARRAHRRPRRTGPRGARCRLGHRHRLPRRRASRTCSSGPSRPGRSTGWWTPRWSLPVDDGTWRFSHPLVHDAAYAGLLASRRRRLHARLADRIEAGSAARCRSRRWRSIAPPRAMPSGRSRCSSRRRRRRRRWARRPRPPGSGGRPPSSRRCRPTRPRFRDAAEAAARRPRRADRAGQGARTVRSPSSGRATGSGPRRRAGSTDRPPRTARRSRPGGRDRSGRSRPRAPRRDGPGRSPPPR